jgi:DNA gyrase subunit A
VNLLQLAGGELVSAVLPVSDNEEDKYLVMATRSGVIKKTKLSEFANIRSTGLKAVGLGDDDELIGVLFSGGDDDFIVGTRKGQSIRFNENDVRAMGRLAVGVRSIRLADDDAVVDVERVIPGGTVLTITENGIGKRTDEEAYRTQQRGGKGIIAMTVNERTGDLVGLKMVEGDEDIMLIRDDGTIIRMPVEEINVISRATQGVKLMRVDEGTRVVSVTVVPHSEESDEAEGEEEE